MFNISLVLISILRSTRAFNKIQFINKDMDFIDLHSIFMVNLVISSIPNYFYNSETPINAINIKKTIKSTIFNLNKIVTDMTIDSNTPDSWDCKKF